ncbi:MAG: precorrin-6y C5,15-methyltransferase (decarboxylating) subunit CbiE [Deltaproteobacteria bacterium]|nr:precorrin-6y C5,15-methyltransferase (decarboxylating) subunit CbiE [Deltaproteobacteria bacterium]
MLYIIGIGVHGLEGLAPRSMEIIKNASLVIGAERHLKFVSGINHRTMSLGPDMGKTLEMVKGEIKRKKDVALLATGDPLFFGIGELTVKKLGKKQVAIIPNVSIVQEAFSLLKEGWAGTRILSLHGRKDTDKFLRDVNGEDKVAVFTDPLNTPSFIARTLLDAGIRDYTVYVLEAIGAKEERIIKGTLHGIAGRRRFNPLNLMVLIKKQTKKPSAPVSFGMSDDLFIHTSNTMTKQEIRAIVLARLGIAPQNIVWDVGAGFGTVSIEAAGLVSSARVYAIEKKRARADIIEKNKARFGVLNLSVIKGAAPPVLKKLPRPDRVFIGGGGEDIVPILSLAAKNLRGCGRIVVSAVTVETFVRAASFFIKQGWDWEMMSVNISKTKKLGSLNMLNASNPVFIITANKAS